MRAGNGPGTGRPTVASTRPSALPPMSAPTRLIVNPNAGSAHAADLSIARDAPGIDVVEVESEDETRDAATAAARDGVRTVVAAGGDGTLHLVANGLMAWGETADDRPALAVLPLGTGNDFARTLGLPLDDLATCLRCIGEGVTRPLDLIRYRHEDQDGYAVNVCAGGFSGVVGETLTPELKSSWGPLAYLIGAAKLLPDLTDYRTDISWDGGPAERLDAFNVVVANGRTAAGGQPVAPRANPEDGLLDVVVVRAGTALDLARLAALVLAGDYITDDAIVFNQVRRVRITSTPGMWFNVDGELRTNEPVEFEAVPGALHVVVGPDYVAAAPASGDAP